MNPMNILVGFTNFIIWYILSFTGLVTSISTSILLGVFCLPQNVFYFLSSILTYSWLSSINLVIYCFGLFLVTFMLFSVYTFHTKLMISFVCKCYQTAILGFLIPWVCGVLFYFSKILLQLIIQSQNHKMENDWQFTMPVRMSCNRWIRFEETCMFSQ